jgi:hypothetical protein
VKLKVALAAMGILASTLAAPAAASAAVRPAIGPCTYNYAIWWTSTTVNFSGGDDCGAPVYVQLYKILPNGTKQFAAFGQGMAVYTCQGTALNTFQSAGTMNGEVFTLTNFPCG